MNIEDCLKCFEKQEPYLHKVYEEYLKDKHKDVKLYDDFLSFDKRYAHLVPKEISEYYRNKFNFDM